MTTSTTYDLIIAGAGPVGLLSALLASQSGLRTLVLEKRAEHIRHSRSIGIHPPSLQILSRAGILPRFLEHGVQIHRGHAKTDRYTDLGVLDLTDADTPFPYILTHPQWKTESLLEAATSRSDTVQLLRNHTITGIDNPVDKDAMATVAARTEVGDIKSFRTQFIMACDGKQSKTRTLAGIGYYGKPYALRYAMGDFTDNTGYGSDAVIFLTRHGLIESFPLSATMRRWVVQQERNPTILHIEALANEIQRRCGLEPDPGQCRMFSEFGVERYHAGCFWHHRVILAGDSAHVVSPIGGQGMNLGWLNACDAISGISEIIHHQKRIDKEADAYNITVHRRVRKVIRRAEFNMMLGSHFALPAMRNQLVKLLLASPIRNTLRKRITMQGL